MNNNDYALPSIATIALLILFPLYWVSLISSGMFDSGADFYRSITDFTLFDVLFLLIGVLTVYVYLSLKRLLNDQYGFSGVNLPLNVLIITSVVYVLGLAGIDIVMGLLGDSLGLGAHKFALNANLLIGVGSMIVFGVADILMGVLLLKNADNESTMLKALAIVVIVQGVVEITVVFSFTLIAIFPITLLVLALLFIQKPDTLEVI